MRKHLFVQTGDSQPKCMKRSAGWAYEGDWLNTVPPLAEHIRDRLLVTDRWWLVECDSADAGREVIRYHHEAGAVSAPMPKGSILASGGKR